MKKGLWLFIGLFSVSAAFGNIGGFCAAVDAEGTHAYVGAGQILLAVNASDPVAPVCTGSLYLPGLIEDILVEGTNLYAACGDAGVHRANTSMELLDTFDSPGHAYGLALNGTALYLADGVGGLAVLDAASLAVTDSYSTNGPAMDVVVDGAAVYLLDHFNGVIKLDASLNETAAYGMVAFGNRMASDGTTLHVADGEGKVSKIDMASMTLSTNELVGIPSVGTAVSGSDVFVARGASGVQVLGGALLATPGNASALAVADGKLYVADGFGGLSIFDASTKTLLGSFSGVARSRATAIANGLAYVAAGNQGIRIFDLSDPTDPSFLSTLVSSNALDVAVAGGLLLVADSFQGLATYDLASPAAPAYLGTYTPISPAVVHCVGASGSLVYIAEGYNVLKLDVSNPASPAVVETYTSPDYVFDLDVAGNNVVLATGAVHSVTVDGAQGLMDWSLVDVSDPLTPVAVTNFGPLVRAMQLTLSGDTIYASADDGGTAFVQMPGITNDSDEDGLDDAFEQTIIDFDAGDEFVDFDSVDPDDDFDGDGLSNLHEQLAGTSPVDPQSVFAISALEGEGSGFAVSWHSVAGRTYTIHKSTNLVEGFSVLRSGISATAPVNTHVDLEAGGCAMYMITLDP
ncbi:LVIVD repeat-containing protein [Pontiella sulfatireligans]|uniref:LVIVD repeat protein n=1 Tax=Pontiella sulfatireligans TaxID=2750658 RepID=A0A6C2UQQ2_9BACT|nr:hypothetical protein [Pontiella sulfatireligans]VGO22622.1 hypothetical protein SCARR_04707 [Pontiella sulfatireligans]